MESSVSPFELAVLVVSYLEQSGCRKTAASFKREAKTLFRGAASAPPPPGVRSLLDLLNEYVQLKGRNTRWLALAGRNPLAARMLAALDAEASQQQAAVDAAAQAEQAALAVQEQAALAAQQAQAAWLRERHESGGAGPEGAAAGLPVASLPHHFLPLVQQQQHQAHFSAAQQPGGQPYMPQSAAGTAGTAGTAGAAGGQQGASTTPSRHRKAPPRKRQRSPGGSGSLGVAAGGGFGLLGEMNDAAGGGIINGGGGGGWESPVDLLNLPLDAEGLEALLYDGPLQLRFAENLAQHINDNLGGGSSLGGGAGEAAGRPGPGPSTGSIAAAGRVGRPPSVAGETAGNNNLVAVGSGSQEGGGGSGSGGSGGSGYLQELLADPQAVLAELPGDPLMADVLQTVVRPLAASPNQPATGTGIARRSVSQASDHRQQQQQQQQQQEQQQERGGTTREGGAAGEEVVQAHRGRRQKQQAPKPSRPGSRQHPRQLYSQEAAGGQPGQDRPADVMPPLAPVQPQPQLEQHLEQQQPEQEPQPEAPQQQQGLAPPPQNEAQQQDQDQLGGDGLGPQPTEASITQQLKDEAAVVAGPSLQQSQQGDNDIALGASAPPPSRPRRQQVLSSGPHQPPALPSSLIEAPSSLPTNPVAAAPSKGDATAAAGSEGTADDGTAAAAARLLCRLQGLGPLEVAASKSQILQDIDDLF